MKKLICVLLAITSTLFFSNFAIASNKASPVSLQTPIGVPVAKSAIDYPTDISIVNYSSRYIDIYVPVLHFSGRLYPHYTQHVLAYDPDPKRVILYNYTGAVFFDDLVSNHHIVNVYDFAGKNEVTVR